MGVQGLWELLAPVGRRVSVETLAGKKLAIDASIWMVQFMKAMRDEKGEMLRNAHILGFFRRICKLLFLRTRPVFVFDGGTPALKRLTIAARRRQRDNARAKIRKTAEKLLLNHLKAKKLEELAAEIKHSKLKDVSKGKQAKDDLKGKRIVHDGESWSMESSFGHAHSEDVGVLTQENLDGLLAASLAAEEERKFTSNEPASTEDNLSKEEADEVEDEEMIYPVTSGNIDPTVLASLPPSVQLDLLVQMRERLMAENRKKYQKIEKAPSKFSQLQIESYLKTVAFRREIDEVQKCAVGRGIGGLQTSRIASEANKEFIFSSFIGDKQKLTSTGFEKIDMDHHALNNSSLNPVNCSSRQSESATTASLGESTKDIGHDVQTNCDEQVHVHVSRVKGLRFGMTRDLQHNLNLLKKYEQENGSKNMCAIPEPSCAEVHDGSKLFDETNFSSKSSLCNEENYNPISENSGTSAQADGTHHFDEPSTLGSQAAMEISFLEDESERKDTDDNVFLHLVYGRSNLEPFNDNIPVNDSDLDSIWEEGVVEGSTATWTDQVKGKNDSSLASRMHLEDDEVDWEDGFYPASKVMSDSQDTHKNAVSIGLSEEEADVQEAIRRSLEDFERLKSVSSNDTNPKPPNGETNLVQFPKKSAIERNVVSTHVQVDTNPSSSCSQCIKAQPDDILQTKYSPKNHHSSNMNFDGESSLNDKANEGLLDSSNDLRRQPIVNDGNEVVSHANNFSTIDTVEVHLKEESLDTFKHGGGDPPMVSREEFAEISANMNLENIDSSSSDKAPEIVLADGSSDNFFRRSYGNTSCQKTSVVEKSVVGIDEKQDQDIVLNNKDFVSGGNCFMGETAIQEPFDVEMSEASLDKEISLLRQERADLGDEQRKLERNAESVSSEMFAECQELLQMFGLPYIIAPMEAEAQCAYMEMKNLVDGVVTDDSDVFLFGARSVYKNIFDDRKYVETYFMKDVESELGLTREKLICMALLLGSDYTEGVSGIGIVNAIEIVNAFPEEDGLRKFREWLESPDPSILGKLDSHIGTNLKKKSSKASKNDADEIRHNVEGSVYEDCISRGHNDQPTSSNISEIKEIFMNKHRNLSKNWHIPSSFPSESVVSAYTSPQVDESTEPFSWGKPDLFLLRKLCWDRFGWSNQKADELLVPVLKEYDKHEIQLRLEAFYTFNERFAKIRSQRIKKAVKGITGTCSSELMDDLVQECSKSRTKRIREENKLENHPDGKITRERKASKPSRRQKTETQDMQIEDGAGESVTSDQDERNARSGFNVDVRGRGKLRGGGRLRKSGRQKGRGRSKVELKFDCNKSTEASSSDDCNGADEMEKLMEMPKDNSELRRSTRRRKQIDFMEENVDADNICCSSTPIDGAAAGDAVEQEPVKNRGKGLVGDAYSIDQEWNQNLLMESCSKDYILTGGGFCIDESDNEGDATQPVVSPERALVESFEERTTNVEDFPGRDDLKSTFKEPSQEDSLVIGTNSNLEQGAAKHEVNPGLRAMPSLKRKRSKA